MDETSCGPCLDRRRLLGRAAALGVAAPLLAACGSGSNTNGTASGGSAGGSSGGGSPSKQKQSGGGGAPALVATADVPVDGGVILNNEQIVVTQPAKGQFKAFSAICTHQGCLVAQVQQGTIICPCHGSQFSVQDGSVVAGPATSPLPPVNVKVQGSNVVRG